MAQAWLDFRPLPVSFMIAIVWLAVTTRLSLGSSSTFRTISASSLRVSDVFRIRSSLDCAQRCTSSRTCSGFCYNSSASLCYLSEAASSASPVTLTDPGDKSLVCYFPKNCPTGDGYIISHDRCVKRYPKQDYQTATSTCAQHGAHLYHYKSDVWDKPAILELFKDTVGLYKIWLGADDSNSPRTYTWRPDGTVLSQADPLWSIGEPSYDSNVNCVQMVSRDYRYNDVPCHFAYNVVCQVEK